MNNLELLKQVVATLEDVVAKLLYRYGPSTHPNPRLRNKLFKDLGHGKVRLLKDQKTIKVNPSDTSKSKTMPADMGA